MAVAKRLFCDLKIGLTFHKRQNNPNNPFYFNIAQKEPGVPMEREASVPKHEVEVFALGAKVLGDMSVTAVIFCFTCWQTYISKQQQKPASPTPCKPRR